MAAHLGEEYVTTPSPHFTLGEIPDIARDRGPHMSRLLLRGAPPAARRIPHLAELRVRWH